MPTRNALPYLDAAIESILGQTFGDFEFLIRDDGSTDGTTEALRDWARRDSRIRLHEGPQLGLAGSSNWVVREARAPIVARMDADDVARSDRLERQMALFRQAPDLVLAGALWTTIDGDDRVVRGPDFWRVFRRSCFAPFAHATIMFRRDAFAAAGGYRAVCEYWEDLEFALRMGRVGRIAVIADDLLLHRESRSSSRLVRAKEERIENAVEQMYRCLAAVAEGRSYDPLLASAAGRQPPARVRPMALVSINSNRIWAGDRPRMVGRVLRRARVGVNLRDFSALGWAALAALSPTALRGALRAIGAARNLLARRKVVRGGVYSWDPHAVRARRAVPLVEHGEELGARGA
jgi:glycosyltransferase involved in cell wall biosynthesis